MRDPRSFLVSVAAVCFATAIGVALGSGPLRGSADADLRDQADASKSRVTEQARTIKDLNDDAAYERSVVKAMGPRLAGDSLQGRHVSIIVLPGAAKDTVTGISATLDSAGASVTGTTNVAAKWAKPNQTQFLEDLSARLVTADLKFEDGAGAYSRAGTVLARGLVTDDAKAAGKDDPETTGILGGLSAGDLIASGEPQPRADLAVVVAPERPNTETAGAWRQLAAAIDRASVGTVVAGSASSTDKGGVVRAVRSDESTAKQISTVDRADTPGGHAVVARALAEQADGDAGHYGASGNDGAAPE